MLVYTFRTYPYVKELQSMFPNVFIFGNLKEDLEIFKQHISSSSADILGVADTKDQSRIESFAVNIFGKGRLEISGPEQVRLFIPPQLKEIAIAKKPTTTFCNWTMYKIQRFIETEGLNRKVSFVHMNMKDLTMLEELAS